jgi:hypothetical protein
LIHCTAAALGLRWPGAGQRNHPLSCKQWFCHITNSSGVQLSFINPANGFNKQHFTQSRIYEAFTATP